MLYSRCVRCLLCIDNYSNSSTSNTNPCFCCSYGYLTWEWHKGLRGYTYPTVFAVVYKLLGILHIDSRTLVVSTSFMLFFHPSLLLRLLCLFMLFTDLFCALCIDEGAAASSRSLCCGRWSLCFSSVSASLWSTYGSMDSVVSVDIVVHFLLLYTHSYQQCRGRPHCCGSLLLSMASQNSVL